MDHEQRKKIVEALIIAAPAPVSAAKLANIVPRLTPAKAREIVEDLRAEYEEQNRAFEIWNVAGGYQVRTRGEYSAYVKQLQPERPLRLSRAALETLSIIAYRQPVTRAEIEQVRGVDAGPVVRSLLDRGLVRTAGHREVPGRPMLYSTSPRFLEIFGLKNLKDLPSLRDLEELGGEADIGSPGPAALADESDDSAEGEGGASPDSELDSPAPSAGLH